MLTRRIPAVETLGATTALCVDKTGTLTLNRMSVAELAVGEEIQEIDAGGTALPETFHAVVEFSMLASPADPFDPMEKAMKELGERSLAGTEHLHRDWELLREYPLSPHLLAMSRVWRSPQGQAYVIAAKGAPEAIADLCHLPEAQRRTGPPHRRAGRPGPSRPGRRAGAIPGRRPRAARRAARLRL